MELWRTIGAFLISGILLIVLTGCGWDGGYRYPCQDPANWGSVECEPPICVPNGTCTRDLIYARTPNP